MESLHEFSLPPALLQRGFWIYIWKITRRDGSPIFYVGMTGDTGSSRAQSPINRLSAHLGFNPRNNALRRGVERMGIKFETCHSMKFAAYGPISEVPEDNEETYRAERRKVAALEKALWLALKKDGRDMVNDCPHCRDECDAKQLAAARSAFASFMEK
jgi:hypothetical protein